MKTLIAAVAAAAAPHAAASAAAPQSMNGDYIIANPATAPGEYPVGGGPAPPFRGEYIDIYSGNISTHYAEVFWTSLPTVALPPAFVSRFAGKAVKITGYEYDSVRPHPAGGGREISVPLFEQYNHHHNAFVHGASSRMADVGPAGIRGAPSHGGVPMRAAPRPVALADRAAAGFPPLALAHGFHGFESSSSSSSSSSNPATIAAAQAPPPQVAEAAFIVDGNGGEYKKSRHGTAAPWGVLVHSPSVFTVQPMMINTRDPAAAASYPFNTKGPSTDPAWLPAEAASPPNATYVRPLATY